MGIKIQEKKIKKFRKLVLDWGKNNIRDFKWRNSSDPYEVLIAEMMLQRTKAEQIEDVYVKFLEKFPDVKTLANADVRKIENAISSIGLKYRGRRMKTVAKKIVELYEGTVPDTEKELLELPGIGRYVASAVLCMAFKKDVPVFDSNVARIVGRVFSIETTAESHKKKEFWELMQTFLPKGKAREFNLALIDIGSLICTPRNPKQDVCPVRKICDYNKEGEGLS